MFRTLELIHPDLRDRLKAELDRWLPTPFEGFPEGTPETDIIRTLGEISDLATLIGALEVEIKDRFDAVHKAGVGRVSGPEETIIPSPPYHYMTFGGGTVASRDPGELQETLARTKRRLKVLDSTRGLREMLATLAR